MAAETVTPTDAPPTYLPNHYTAADLADAKGVTPGAIHRDLHRQRAGKPGVVPQPDPPRKGPGPLSRALLWSVDRADVAAFIADPSVTVWK